MYDGDRLIAELDDQGAVIATLSWGAAGLFAYGSTQYQFDLQGSVVARTSSIGSVLSTHWYDAHGTEQTTPSSEPFAYKGRYGYYTDRETGLILCTHRYLDPAAGRWLTRDPISYAGGVSLYSYCRNRPSIAEDRHGLKVELVRVTQWGCGGCSSPCGGIHYYLLTDMPSPSGSPLPWSPGIAPCGVDDQDDRQGDMRVIRPNPDLTPAEQALFEAELIGVVDEAREHPFWYWLTHWCCYGSADGWMDEALDRAGLPIPASPWKPDWSCYGPWTTF
ncbi:MAG: RHS repeat-associated core domain-containing protein [Phycisphaerales bacterium]|nr:RHS repeat-associated core domain-containing protein [Phycisphaerales bacterium]